jgi:hypothetical protein
MRVVMNTRIGGFRNGEPWPEPGGVIDVPDHEAVDLIANGYASEADPDEIPAIEENSDGEADEDADTASGEAAAGEGDEDATTARDEASDLEALTVAELRELAAERGVDLDGLTKKADILEALS